ncbi:DUF2442 domain-containing protein [Catalinimonas sp. 4WD22]|uniref:DUF2442 domain-containing protein n=1 Tax=Catalinimonas locisalis TaxID=3133978 RepID=UPI003100FFFF
MKITERYTGEGSQIAVKEAHYIGDYAIRLAFSDGNQKLVDFKPFLEKAKHPSVQKYLDESRFKNFEIKGGNLDWNDFELCFPIEDLYNNTVMKEEGKTALT